MAEYTVFGPGTIEIGATGSEVDFAGEVLGGNVTHTYEEIGESRTMLDGTVRASSSRRVDGLAFTVENDLTAAGLYSTLFTGDGTEEPFTYTPNTEGAAAWAGKIKLSLPAEVGADEFGAPIVSTVELTGVGAFTFTPATATP